MLEPVLGLLVRLPLCVAVIVSAQLSVDRFNGSPSLCADGSSCFLLFHDPINKVFVPVAYVGLIVASTILLFSLPAKLSSILQLVKKFLEIASAVSGLALTLYSIFRTGGLCVPCTVFNTCMIIHFLGVVATEGSKSAFVRNASFTAVGFLLATAGVVMFKRSYGTNLLDLSALNRVEVRNFVSDSVPICKGEPGSSEYLLIVDLACGECRKLLRNALGSKANVYVLFKDTSLDYSMHLARLLYANRQAKNIATLWKKVLEDESLSYLAVDEFVQEKQFCKPSVTSRPFELARVLKVRFTPVAFRMSDSEMVPIDHQMLPFTENREGP